MRFCVATCRKRRVVHNSLPLSVASSQRPTPAKPDWAGDSGGVDHAGSLARRAFNAPFCPFAFPMTAILTPATLAFREDGTPFSPVYGDIYHSASGALEQSHSVFLQGNELPERWRGRRVFTVLETGFGIGVNFLTTWQAWRNDPSGCERLHFVSVEKHPFVRDDLRAVLGAVVANTSLGARAQELADAWPMLVPGVHRLEFEGGRVTLTLVFGDAAETLPKLWLRADAFYLDGFAPAKNHDIWSPEIFKALARVAGEGATFATWSSAGEVKRALVASGFAYRKVAGFGSKRAMLVGRFAPRWRVRRYEPPLPAKVRERHAIVVGAGMAGCALVERLAARGWRVTLIERQPAPAREASGNPAGVFHPLISRDDSSTSRITRAAYLYALQRWAALEAAGHTLARMREGLLHLATDDESRAVAAALESFCYPDEYAFAVSRERAEEIAGVALAQGGWFYPLAGAISPASLCSAQCAAAGALLDARFGTGVARIERAGDAWRAFDDDGALIAEAPVMIFANAHDAARAASLDYAPTRLVRGQLTIVARSPLAGLRVPVIGDGYALPLADGVTLTGATYELDDTDDAILNAIVPTYEVHVNTPLNHRGGYLRDPAGTPDVVDFTYGLNAFLYQQTKISFGVATPVTGPRPFSYEIPANISYRF